VGRLVPAYLALGLFLLLSWGSLQGAMLPNQLLYEPAPFVHAQGGLQGFELYLAARVITPTPWKWKVDDPLVAGLAFTESSFILHSVSPSMAIGLFQLKPFTALENGITNPFSPRASKGVGEMLASYRNKLGSTSQALAAYHLGVAGAQRSANAAVAAQYVNKVTTVQRQYVPGQRVALRDFQWFSFRGSFAPEEGVSGDVHWIVPVAWLGSLSVNAFLEGQPYVSLLGELFLHPLMQLHGGFQQNWITGMTLRSPDWAGRVTVSFDWGTRYVSWQMRYVKPRFQLGMCAGSSGVAVDMAFRVFDGFWLGGGVQAGNGWGPFLVSQLRF